MPIQAPQWMDYLNCPVCCREFGAPPRSPISLACGHTLCSHCLNHLHRRQCPFDQSSIQVDPEELVVNTALLQLAGHAPPKQPHHPPSIQALCETDRQAYDYIVKCMEHLAAYLKYCVNNTLCGGRFSRPMQRKLVMLLQCPITDAEGRGRAARAARSLGERTVTELILQHQNPQQLSAHLWAAVRARGCQFLGPAMQEEVLKLVLLALEDGSALSRKVLVMFVVQRLEPHFPQASKTSIGHVVQLLYRASCFKVSKRECDSSLMQLKEEFRSYESLRREHDAQIVQIATEAGLRIAPDQWSALLYGDVAHKSHMQSIIDKLQTPQSFAQSVQELFISLQRTGDPAQLVRMSLHLDRLTNIDATQDGPSPSWCQLADVMTSLKEVVAGLVYYIQLHACNRDNNNHKHNNTTTTDNLMLEQHKYNTASVLDVYTQQQQHNNNNNRCEDIANRVNSNYNMLNNKSMTVPVQTVAVPPPPTQTQHYQQYVVPHRAHHYNIQQTQRPSVSAITDATHATNGQPIGYTVVHPSVMLSTHLHSDVVSAGGGADQLYYRLFNSAPGESYGTPDNIYHPMLTQYYVSPQPPPPPPPQYCARADTLWPTPPPPPPPPPLPPSQVYNFSDAMNVTQTAPSVDMYNFSDMMNVLPTPSTTDTFAPHATVLPFTSRRSSPVDAIGPKAVGGPVLSRPNGPNVSEAPSPDPVVTRMSMASEIVQFERSTDTSDDCAVIEPTSNVLGASYEDTGLDYEQLEAGLQALERRIDTEFKSAD